jgi:pimeloyl-ACP methyl ester carboxylesterase
VELHYEEHGTGDPALLLHGFTSSFAGTWKRTGWVKLLVAQGRRVVGLDFPGHGESAPGKSVERCRGESLARDVLALLDGLGLTAVDLVGFSMGAGVALRVAMSHPARVRRLVIGGIGDTAVNALHDPEQVARIASAFEGDEPADAVAARIRRNAELAGNDPRALLPYLRGGGWPGGLDDLLPVTAPVLMFVAENDRYMGETQAIRRWLSHAEVLTLPGRGHHDVLADDNLKTRVLRFLEAP